MSPAYYLFNYFLLVLQFRFLVLCRPSFPASCSLFHFSSGDSSSRGGLRGDQQNQVHNSNSSYGGDSTEQNWPIAGTPSQPQPSSSSSSSLVPHESEGDVNGRAAVGTGVGVWQGGEGGGGEGGGGGGGGERWQKHAQVLSAKSASHAGRGGGAGGGGGYHQHQRYTQQYQKPQPSGKREQGRVCALKESFGFVRCMDRPGDLFFHLTEAPPNVSVGDEVDFSVGTSNRWFCWASSLTVCDWLCIVDG